MADDAITTFDVQGILRSLPHLDLTRDEVPDNDRDAFPMQAPFASGGLFIGGFTGQSPWECHTDLDELLYAVEGEVEITMLTETGVQRGVLRQGSACVVPKGLWHRQFSRNGVKLMTISGPGPISLAEDPRKSEPS